MIRAILDGRKTQTRRVIKMNHPSRYHFREIRNGRAIFDLIGPAPKAPPLLLPTFGVNCPYGNAILWVRETFQFVQANSDGQRGAFKSVKPFTQHDYQWIEYAATPKFKDALPWKPSIFMPRWASRITLEITNIRAERLQDISEDDAKAEGVEASKLVEMKDGSPCYSMPYQILWNQINGVGSWDANPWVFVIDFKPAREVIDGAIKGAIEELRRSIQ